MDYTIADARVHGEPVKAVRVNGATLNLQVETLKSAAIPNGRQTNLSLQVRVVRLDDDGSRIDEGPVVCQTVAGESNLRLQAELDNLVERAIKVYVLGLSVRQAAASIPDQLVGAVVERADLNEVAKTKKPVKEER